MGLRGLGILLEEIVMGLGEGIAARDDETIESCRVKSRGGGTPSLVRYIGKAEHKRKITKVWNDLTVGSDLCAMWDTSRNGSTLVVHLYSVLEAMEHDIE
ncbi:hypothetical protein PIB30_052338 [Stylosanthes scabra]|uniref:Uncharacterized protein n=1 Tax=Stylosanthes scabra TaxID=79078 RepID=A0ABU6YIB8_9FABA|nr:hypothetical protein [Stylosanthes scabra]